MNSLPQPRTLTLAQVRDMLNAQAFTELDLSAPVQRVGAADLMSDVLALGWPGMLLLTGLVGPQVIRTAIVADLCGVVFVRGKKPSDDILALALKARIPVLGTALTMFEAAGVLYGAIGGR